MTTWLVAAGGDAVLTLDLPNGNRTTDQEVTDAADQQQRVVITKGEKSTAEQLRDWLPDRWLLSRTRERSIGT